MNSKSMGAKESIQMERRSEAGSTLGMTLLISGVLGIVLASYLTMVDSEHRAVARSQSWNLAIPEVEGAIEESLAHIQQNGLVAVDGWSSSGGTLVKTRNFVDQYWVARISATNPPSITVTGYARVTSKTNTFVSRAVQVTTRSDALFAKGLVADGQINLNGNNITSDSFDSTDPLYSTGGLYDPAKRLENGDIATNSGLVNSVNVGNADIYGSVATGPGGSVSIGNNGFVTGTVSDDMNVDFPDASVPFSTAVPPASGTVNGVTYSYVLTSGDWQVIGDLSLSGTSKILVMGDARLHVTGNFSMSGNSFVHLTNAASLKLYVGGASTSLGGNGIVNGSNQATNFMYYGLPTNTSLSMSGNAAFTGLLYAPSANLTLGGGGNNTYDFVGAGIANTITMNGHFNFHYDESLGRVGPTRGYVVNSWKEL